MANKSQTDKILAYLSKGRVLTPIEALNKFGCFRLAARIADLRSQGHTIWTNKVIKNGKSFAGYSLSKNIKIVK